MRIRTRLITLVGLMILGLYAPSVYADSVVLTGGSITTVSNVGTVSLTGPNFSLHYAGDIPGGATSFGMNSVSLSLGNPSVTFNGVTSAIFAGSVSFNNSSVSGTVTAYNSMDDLFFHINPIFSVTFSGNGFITIINLGGASQTQFSVTSSVPEPATLLQLFAGLSSGGAILFRRRHAKAPPVSSE